MGSTQNPSDGYVRIAESELEALRLEHLTSEVDMSIPLALNLAQVRSDVVTGFTEWAGSWKGATASLGWDWSFIHRQLALINLPEIRTNILLIGQDGSAHSPHFCRVRLAQWLETQPWQNAVMQAVGLAKDR